jgi:hypothetical protein
VAPPKKGGTFWEKRDCIRDFELAPSPLDRYNSLGKIGGGSEVKGLVWTW